MKRIMLVLVGCVAFSGCSVGEEDISKAATYCVDHGGIMWTRRTQEARCNDGLFVDWSLVK